MLATSIGRRPDSGSGSSRFDSLAGNGGIVQLVRIVYLSRMNTKTKGDIAESRVLAELVSDFDVSIPFGDNTRYDLLVDDGTKIWRVQVKHARCKEGKIKFHTVSKPTLRGNDKENRDYKGDADLFAVYSSEIDTVAYVTIEEVGDRVGMTLRFSKPENGQSKGINWLRDYKNWPVAQTG